MDASLFTTDTATQCEFSITPSDLDSEHSHDLPSHHNNNTGIHFYSKHKYRDNLVMHTYSIMILITVIHLITKINIQHCYNKSYKTPIGAYMIQSQLKVIRYLQTWILKPCHMPCILMIMQLQLVRLTTFHTKLKYNDKGMFPAQLMDNTPIQVFIDNTATPSILPLSTKETSYTAKISHNKKHNTHPHRRWYNQIALLDRSPIDIRKSNHPN